MTKQQTAHQLVSVAIRRGILSRPDACGRCGVVTARIHGHHSDYDRPLVVEWLCPKCHKTFHPPTNRRLDCVRLLQVRVTEAAFRQMKRKSAMTDSTLGDVLSALAMANLPPVEPIA